MSEREVGLGDHSGIGDLLLVARVLACFGFVWTRLSRVARTLELH